MLANQVADHPLTVKKIGGTGPVVSDLEWDVKTYFTLAGATHNAACACWGIKRYYQGARPITMIRYMASKGQSSDPGLPSYHVQGLPLEQGVSELITAETAAPGGRHAGVGSAGEVAVYSWPGEPADRTTQTSPVRWIKGVNWLPYQRKNFNTPPFPGYTSGHSTFSRAAAEALTAITGTPNFPGGLGTFTPMRIRISSSSAAPPRRRPSNGPPSTPPPINPVNPAAGAAFTLPRTIIRPVSSAHKWVSPHGRKPRNTGLAASSMKPPFRPSTFRRLVKSSSRGLAFAACIIR